MAGISSKAANSLENKKNTFQNQELNDDLGVDIYEFKYRCNDGQTGRFWQIDPLADKYVYNSTYAFSENKVTSHVELEGLESVNIHGAESQGLSQDSKDPATLKKNIEAFENGNSKGNAQNVKSIPALIVMAALILQPEVGIPMALSYLTGAPVTPSPQAMATTSAASASANLEKQVVNVSTEMANNGRYPAAVVGASASDGSIAIRSSGKIPEIVAPKLQTAAKAVGGVGNVNAGNVVGCCAEFKAANVLMLNNPTLVPTKINFTPAIRPRTGEFVPPCKNCITIFPQLNNY